MVITEAKNDNVMGGLGQCAAAMVAAQRFNRGRNSEITTVYGCVSTGIDWKFLRLSGTTLEIDLDDYVIHNPGRILGIVMSFVSLPAVKTPAAA
jgi:outer membrane lipoprotein SlyB